MVLNSMCRKHPEYAKVGEGYNDAEFRTVADKFDAYYGKHEIEMRGKTVLDAGCGHGGKTAYYASKGCGHIYGVDMDDLHVANSKAFAEEKGIENATFTAESLDNLSFDADTFDLIFMNDVLEHIVRSKLGAALAELKRVLKPGGRLLLEFPPWSSPYAAHLYQVIDLPWCQCLFSDATLINVINKLGGRDRKGSLSYIDHFLELNRCTISEFREMVRTVNFEVIDIHLMPVRQKEFLTKIPFFGKFFVFRVHAALSKGTASSQNGPTPRPPWLIT